MMPYLLPFVMTRKRALQLVFSCKARGDVLIAHSGIFISKSLRHFAAILAQESFRPTVRLKMSFPSVFRSGSTQK